MGDLFFLLAGIILAGVGLLLLTAKLLSTIKCTVPVQAAVVKLKKEYSHFRGLTHTHYRPVVRYVVGGKGYTEEAYFRTSRKSKYPIGSEMKLCYNPKKPEETRFVGHPFPLPLGLVFLFLGVVLISCYFL